MYFINELTGWKARGNMKKTTDGGSSWNTQTLPSGSSIIISSIIDFSNMNSDTIWGVGARTSSRGLIYKTTNGGEVWGYQLPDTSINIWQYLHIDFVNELNGWAYHTLQGGVHTVTGGGDTTYYTGVNLVSGHIPKGFRLYQNYPNPFNPITKIKFEVPKSSFVKMIVYDILGEEVAILVNERLNSGSYEISWNGSNYPSSVYFYSLITKDFSETKRMLLIK